MNIPELLARLDERGIQIDRREDRLLVRSLHGAVDDEVRQLLRDHKAALLAEIDRSGADAPASSGQQQLWLIDQVEGGGCAYNATAVLRVHGPVDDAALDAAFTGLVHRNEVFRTGLVVRNGELRQHVRPSAPVAVDHVDLGDLPVDTADARIREVADASAMSRFDLANDVLVRATRLRESDGDTVLVITMHHVAGDGLSMGLLHAELAELYAAAASGREPVLPPQPGQYRDYARHQWQTAAERRKRLDDEQADAFWVRYLDGAPSTVVPLDRPRPARRTFAGDCVRFRLDAGLVARLRDVAASHETTLFVVLLAVLGSVLGRHGGQEDVVVATPVVDRPERRFEGMIGYFLNTVVIRCDLSGGCGFGALVDRVRDSTLDALAHADTPFEQVVRSLGVQRSGTGNPVYQVMFALQTGRRSRPRLAGNEVEEIPYDPPTAKHDLTIMLDEDEDGLLGRLEYSTAVLDRESACLLAEHLVALAAAVAADPSRPVAPIPLATDAERAWIAEREGALSLRVVDGEGTRVPPGVIGRLVLDDGVSPERQLAHRARWRPRGGVEVLDDTSSQPSQVRQAGFEAAGPSAHGPATPSALALVAEVWADVIGRHPVDHEDFFALGGTSMAMMEVHWQLRRRAGVEVPIADLLEDPTVVSMARLVAQYQERAEQAGHEEPVARWTRVGLPLRGPGHLWNVAAVSATSMWAAGVRETPGSAGVTRSVVMRWDGDGWHEMPHPDLEKVFGVAVAPSGAVWLSGRRGLLCFDGAQFHRVEGDAPRYDCASITRIGDELWTMVRPDDTPGAPTHVAVGGEDGGWRRLSLPLPQRATTRFGGLAGTSGRDVWAAVVVDVDDASRESWLAHWDGERWDEVVPPPLGRAGVEIMRIVTLGPEDVWLLGARLTDEGRASVMVRWDGQVWTEATLPAGHRGRITSLVAASDGTLWAVGGGQGDAGVVLRSDDGGRHWTSDVAPSSVLFGDIVLLPRADGFIVGGAADDGMALFRREGIR